MTLDVSTPALLFPAISLLFLSYTNRFLHLSSLIRELYGDWTERHDETSMKQINNLGKRLVLIRWMQFFGAVSLFLCVLSMVLVISEWMIFAVCTFITGLVLMGISLICLMVEVWISGGALRILLSALEKRK